MAKTNNKSAATTVADIAAAMERIAPLHLAEPWDNVGLLAGSRKTPAKKVLLTIDLTRRVFDEAVRMKVDMVIAYHPPLFKPLKKILSDGDEPAALAVALANRGIALYSPHTALDTVQGGTNDVLAEQLGARITGSFTESASSEKYLKLVTFVPPGEVEQVADAVFEAGAGRIGQRAKYEKCSFRVSGHGTFLGDADTNPAVGKAGIYERVIEVRFETVLPATAAGNVIRALRAAHPYEEPAFDLLEMAPTPEGVGLGRYAELAKPEPLTAFARRCRETLGLKTVLIIGNPKKSIRTLALVAGSAGMLILDRARQPYDCVITGELKHHEMLAYEAAGKGVVLLGHSDSERPILGLLAKRLRTEIPGLSVLVSRADSSPTTAV